MTMPRSVACFRYHSFEFRYLENGVDDVLADAREEGEHHYIGVEQVMRLHGPGRVRTADEMLFVADVYAWP